MNDNMEKYKRIFLIVLDSLGIGAMPDSERFGDRGVDTLGHILEQMGTLAIPNLKKLGLLNLHCAGDMKGRKILLAGTCALAKPVTARIP